MQVKEHTAEGLKRELEIIVGADELGKEFDARLEDLKGRIHLKGFRPGKVPIAHLKRVYGRQVMAEVLQKTLLETSRKAISDRGERPAAEPDLKLSEDKDEIDRLLKGEADLSYKLSFEILPKIELGDFSKLKLEKMVAEVTDDEIEEMLAELRDRATTYEARPDRKAEKGDRVTVDFIGRIAGEEVEDAKAEDLPIILGEGAYIPGFEEGLEGVKAGETVEIKTKFPDDYPVKDAAGKDVVFEIKVKEVAVPKRPSLDDEFAKTLGLESLEALRKAVAGQLRREHEAIARSRLKRQILDKLNESYDFPLPPSLVEKEFEALWKELTTRMEHSGKSFEEEEGKDEESLRKEYRALAERRVRLGLLIAEIAEANDIEVSNEELGEAVAEEVRRYPGLEKEYYEAIRNSPALIAQIRAPVLEEKVIDFLIELAEVEEKPVSKDELYDFSDEDDEA